ncbi:MAG: prepilin-type N-terminal cleavage/methylation domain-containing protein [Gemmataceae bacterium]|nr:prepilin-type N-terminal cleavage/methylation domain-containing protein [Gemmataceae bacterium]
MPRIRLRRSGFTAIELLIVVTILGIIAALTAGAVVRVMASAEKSATETTLTKLASVLDIHWKAVIDSAKKEYDGLPSGIKANLLALADNQANTPATPKPHPRRDDRARLLYVKFRLKQEFPTSFAAAADPAPNYLPAQSVPPIAGLYTGKPAYIKAINGKTIGLGKESAALLVLALQQSRAGVASTPIEQLVGGSFLRQENGLSYLVDSWGSPLQLFIFPTAATAGTTDLNAGNDPQDPEGLLKTVAVSKWQALPIFATLLHPQIDSRRLVPVIVSAGPDRLLGGSGSQSNPTMNLTSPDADDNIYSYRLRQSGARGD